MTHEHLVPGPLVIGRGAPASLIATHGITRGGVVDGRARAGRTIAVVCSHALLESTLALQVLRDAARDEGAGVHLFFTLRGLGLITRRETDPALLEAREFLATMHACGGHLWASRMSAATMHLDEDDLIDEVDGIISAADFRALTDGAQLLFI